MDRRLTATILFTACAIISCDQSAKTATPQKQNSVALFISSPDAQPAAPNKLIWEWDDLEALFDQQIKTLKDRQCPEGIISLLEEQKGSVFHHAQNAFFSEGKIPFIPVIPTNYRSTYDLMASVRYKNKSGGTRITPSDLTDGVETPNGPYFIFHVDGGSSIFSKNYVEVKEEKIIFKNKLREQLTAAEIIAVATHTDLINENVLCATASQILYNGKRNKIFDKRIPVLLLYNDKPILGANTLDVATKICTFPTALYRD